MDFYMDMIREARAWLRMWGLTEIHTGTSTIDGRARAVKTPLEQITDDKIGVLFFRTLRRLPAIKLRTYERSRESEPVLTPSERVGLNALQQEVVAGASLHPRLSRTWVRGDEDALLSDWDIFHFHLGTTFEPDGFVERSNHVALAMLTSDRFLLIDVRPHGRGTASPWTDKELLEIVDRNWPDVLEPYQTTLEIEFKFDKPEEISLFRRVGIVQMYEVNGKTIFPPGGGVASDGGSAQAVLKYNQTVYELRQLQNSWSHQFPDMDTRVRYLPDGYFGYEDENEELWSCNHTITGPKFIPHVQQESIKRELQEKGL